jgi:rfaE bifunctional protein nucleotidyltransferase chain/domain
MLKVSDNANFNSPKIILIPQAVALIAQHKKDSKTVGLCHGGFDLLHPGHIKHFESAKRTCDLLFVSVTADKYVTLRKGAGRPIFPDRLRAYMIAQLTCIDYVVISPYQKGIEMITQLKPTYYIKGPDFIKKQTPGILAERAMITKIGGEIKYTKDPKLSTTQIIDYIKTQIPTRRILIGIDRDGTLIQQHNYLGKESNWRKFLVLNDPVVSFLSYIQTKFKTTAIVISNQSGVARGYFDISRVDEINQTIDQQLKSRGITIQQWRYCPDVDKNFVQKHPEIPFNTVYIRNHTQRKPSPTLLLNSLRQMKTTLTDFEMVLILGDREEDEQLAQNLKSQFINVTDKSYDELVTIFTQLYNPEQL